MMKKKHLKICNYTLLLLFPMVLASGIILESLEGRALCGIANATWTWSHIVLSLVMTGMILWHIRLNWQGIDRWWQRLKKHHSKLFKIMFWTFAATIITGVVVMPMWLYSGHHGIGGFHGKIGFILALLIITHILRHRTWYRP